MRVRTAYTVLGLGFALACVAMLLLLLVPARVTPPPIGGCGEVSSTELHVQHAYACSDGIEVLTFSNVTARDEYAQVATHYGVVIIDKGDAWLRIRGV